MFAVSAAYSYERELWFPDALCMGTLPLDVFHDLPVELPDAAFEMLNVLPGVGDP